MTKGSHAHPRSQLRRRPDAIEVIFSQIVSLLLSLTLDVLPVAFNLIPIQQHQVLV